VLTISISTPAVAGFVIAHDQSRILPLAAQNVAQQETIPGSGHAVQSVERSHEGGHARVDGRAKRREIDFAQKNFGNPRTVVIAACFRRAISHEVFGAGRQRRGIRQRAALKPAHHGRGERAGQAWILTQAFGDAPPSRVSGDIDHRRERPPDAFGRRLARRLPRRLFHEFRIPGCRLRQRDREDRLVAVDYVAAEQ
jgi:hypothetical protein